jgi:hypothetical protein
MTNRALHLAHCPVSRQAGPCTSLLFCIDERYFYTYTNAYTYTQYIMGLASKVRLPSCPEFSSGLSELEDAPHA